MFELIEDYDTGDCLGNGAYGAVYIAKKKKGGDVACVKTLAFCPGNPSVSNPSAADASFDKEVKGLASVQHPNVVKVLGWGRLPVTYNGKEGYCPWILLEYCSQGNLKDFISAKKAKAAQPGVWATGRLGVDEEQVVQWVKDVLSALKELHSRGIMHRDLKPANVVVHASGVAKVCDFGVAASSEHTRQTYAGTAAYMAPQIVYGTGDGYKADADMFSVGVMVLEMFTLSRIPDAQAQGGDRDTDISKLLYIWYAGDRAVARQNEDALHDDVRATLKRRVSRQWSEAVSKLVVGCLYFSRDVRLTADEAAALLAQCSGTESSVSENERESESDGSGLAVVTAPLCSPQGVCASGDCVALGLQAHLSCTTGDSEDESRRVSVVLDLSSRECPSEASGDEATSASSGGGVSDESSEADEDGASSLEIVMEESPEVAVEGPAEVAAESRADVAPAEVAAESRADVAPAEVAAESRADVAPAEVAAESRADVAPAEVAAESRADVAPAEVAAESLAEVMEESTPGVGGFPWSPVSTAPSYASSAAAAQSGDSALQLVAGGEYDDSAYRESTKKQKKSRGRSCYWIFGTLFVVGLIIVVFYIRKAVNDKSSKSDSKPDAGSARP